MAQVFLVQVGIHIIGATELNSIVVHILGAILFVEHIMDHVSLVNKFIKLNRKSF